MAYWKEIKNNFEETTFDIEIDGSIHKIVHIDAWKTDNDDEEGKVIAKVLLTKSGDICVVYIDNVARTDEAAQALIQDTVDTIRDKYSVWIDDESNDDGTYDVMVYDESANETDYALSRGHIATLEQAQVILQEIVRSNPHLLFVRLPNRKK